MKKIICIILAISLIAMYMPVMAATKTFSDVKTGSKYANAIYTLADFGIILGDAGADTFRPQANISREEFSVIMTRVLGLGALNVNVTEYPFPDVIPSTCADWSIKATKIAYDLGIIKGFDDGSFRPKENVTYEQAVKMIVCALGYEKSAIEQGEAIEGDSWSAGYIAVARGFGILNNAETAHDQPASREIIAQLIANSLEVPLAETEATEKRNFLTEKLRYTEATGIVTGIEGSALKSNASGIGADEVQINYALKFKVGETSAKDYLGKQINYYYKNDGANNILVSARLTNKNSEEVVAANQIKALSATKLEYYPDPEDTAIFETFEFDTSNVSAIYNGKYVSKIDATLTPNAGSITLIDNDGNGRYDVLMITSTEVYVVSAVDTAKKIVYNEYNQAQSLNLNATSGQVVVTIVKNGEEVEFNQIKKGDVLLVSKSMSPSGRQAYNVLIVTNTVAGNVTSMNDVSGEVVISGKIYEYSNAYANYIKAKPAQKMNVGDKVTLYLDSDNNILAASVTSIATTTKYGYLIAADALEKNEYAQFKIYTPDNKTLILKGADRVRINGTSYTYDNVMDVLRAANNDTNKDTGATKTDVAQLIKYTTNSSGKVDNIYTLQTSGDPQKALVLSKPYQTDVTYTSSGKHLGSGVTLSTTTKVIFVPTDRSNDDSYSAGTYSKFSNGKKYSFEAYDSSDTSVPAVVVVYGTSGLIGLDDVNVTFALIESITNTLVDGEAVTTVTCLVNGASKTYYCESSSLLSGYQKGDVLKLAFNAKGYIIDIEAAFDFDNLPAEGASSRYVSKSNSTNNYKTVYGTVYARDDSLVTIVPYDVAADGSLVNTPIYTSTVSSSTKVYVLDTTVSATSSSRLTEGTIDAVAGYTSAQSGASNVFAYIKDNVTRLLLIVLK